MDFIMTYSFVFSAVMSLSSICATAALMLFMYFTAKKKNKDLETIWYVMGFLFPMITFFVFLSKSKKFPGENMKVCPNCGKKFPEIFEICNTCLIELPANDPTEKRKQGKNAKLMCALFIVFLVINTVSTSFFAAAYATNFVSMINDSYYDDSSYTWRLPVTNENGDEVYYDMQGNSYEDPDDVKLYDENGNTYELYSDHDEFEYYYVDESGKKYETWYCYVTADGYFYYDEKDEIEYIYADEYEDGNDEDYDYNYDDEDIYDYTYYYDEYRDDEGNLYYDADGASWNEKSELITGENDVNK